MPEKSLDRILLVEDDLPLAEGLIYSLAKDSFIIDHADSAASAKQKFFDGEYSLVLLDVGLPDGSGFDVCRLIRRSSDVGIIFLTACDEEVNIVMGLDIGGDDYITKPFRINELKSRINAVLRRKMPLNTGKSIINSNGFLLDRENSRFISKGTDLQLTTTEFRLVSILIGNKGQILTREKLVERLWDSEEHYIDSNTLSVYIKRVREKIEKDPAAPQIIETIRGVGYRWN